MNCQIEKEDIVLKKKTAKLLGLAIAGSMLVSMAAPGAAAATKMTISKKKITIAVGEKATIKVKKTKKKENGNL